MKFDFINFYKRMQIIVLIGGLITGAAIIVIGFTLDKSVLKAVPYILGIELFSPLIIFSLDVIVYIVVKLLTCVADTVLKIIMRIKKRRYDSKLVLIMENSERCKYLANLPEKLKCETLEGQYIYRRKLRSKAQVDKINMDIQMIKIIDEEQELSTLIRSEKVNQEKLKGYFQALKEAPPYIETEDKLYKKAEIEKAEELERLAKPVIPEFIFIFYYCSPQGRNYYERKLVLSADELLQYYAKRSKVKTTKEMIQYERSIMSDSLRYDIMKRDGFRCVLCGATSADGVKLHVDHIRPVSKGGKTEPANLRTLCERCNLGKRAKYDETGDN